MISPYHLSRAAIKQPFCCVVIQKIFVREVAKLVGLDRDETARGTSRFLCGGVLSQPVAVPKWERITVEVGIFTQKW